MSTHWEAYGTLAFPSAGPIASWRAAQIDAKAVAAVTKLVKSQGVDSTIEAVLAAFRGSTTELVRCDARGANVDVSYLFDGDLMLEHGAALFGALATAAAFGASGTIHVEQTAHMAYVLTLDGRSAKLAKWPKKTPAPAEERAAHRVRVEAWSKEARR